MTERYTILRLSKGGSGLEAYAPDSLEESRIDVADLSGPEIRDLSRDPEVSAFAREMPVALVKPVSLPAPPASSTAWGLAAIRADQSSYDGRDTVVAVLDTGIDAKHPAFAGVEVVEQDFTGEGAGDQNGHGTHCAGILFGRDVGGRRIGVARGVTKALSGKVLGARGGGGSEAVFQALHWALNAGARVISLSLSLDFPGLVSTRVASGWPVDLATSHALESYRQNLRMLDALMLLIQARVDIDGGAVVVAAAGNESRPRYKLAVSVPAAAQGVISVGALVRDVDGLSVAEFSNTQPELSAPGVNILSAVPGGGVDFKNGTSMAAPHVAGVAALWWQALRATSPRVKAPSVIARLRATARIAEFAPHANPLDYGAGLITAP